MHSTRWPANKANRLLARRQAARLTQGVERRQANTRWPFGQSGKRLAELRTRGVG